MTNRALRVIPEPDPKIRSVINFTGKGTIAFTGNGDLNLLCGQCKSMLVQGVGASLESVVIKCNSCGAYNDTD